MNPDIRRQAVRWLVQSAGELQKKIQSLEKQNAALRTENQRLRREQPSVRAIAKAAGS